VKSSWTLIGVVALSLALPAAGQVYTQTRQTRQIETSVTARVPGQPDAADSDSHTSDAPGPFNQLVTSTATAAVPGSNPTVFASGNVEALGGFIPGPDFMSGALAATYRVDSRGGDAGANSISSLETEFTVLRDTPFRLATHLTVTFDPAADDASRDAGGDFLLVDLDTEDPHGGPTAVFGYFLGSDTAWDRQLDGNGTLLAGHRYVLRVAADAGRELLNNPPLPGDHVSYGRSELTFRMDLLPEPSAAAVALFGVPLLLSRRRR
jgi:hypothetical protein